jgi:hypothetical protein
MSLRDTKAELPARHARRSAEEGHTVLVLRLDVPRTTAEGTPIGGMAEHIEAVEREGWRLHSLVASDVGSMAAVFRRSHHQA